MLVCLGDDGYDEQVVATARQARRPQAPRDPRAGDDQRAELAADRRADDGGGGRSRAVDHRAGQGPGRRRASRATSSACAPGQAGRRIIEEAAGHARGRRRARRCRAASTATSVFGKTLETVLNERPCRVIIESSPADSPSAARGGEGPGGGAVTHATRILSGVMVLIGLAMIVSAVARGGGPLAVRGRARDPVRRRRRRTAVGEPVRRDQIVRRWKVLEPPEGLRRGLGSPALFGIVQGFTAASIYFAIGLVVERALGLTLARDARGRRCSSCCSCPPTSRARRCTRSAAARPCSPATRSTSSGASSPAGRSCSTT